MDCPCIPRNMNNTVNDWQHDIQLIDRKHPDTDPYIYYWYKLSISDSQCSLHILVDIRHKDLRDILVNIRMNQRHYVLCIEHSLHKDWDYMVPEFRVHVELRIEEFQLIRCYWDGQNDKGTDFDSC